ncbi:hypothetical protein [Pleionea sp. CnH1-48]|uniref:hypothetical protein n=1 Tax=Pleionea sp. CnH1-48 TaxID=2954494 RepID=UPI00209737D8|nr:hypothetical protein [Pleionea sp. CnH1-48]MCO7223524.1 hypothetical protein [Pleionea sp. CnH1-48]
MSMVVQSECPGEALYDRYYNEWDYTDCFITEVTGEVSLEQFVEAFYTTYVFKMERVVLACLVFKFSSDRDVEQLVKGESDKFAAWTIEDRADDQLLMCDFQRKTRSWFKVEPYEEDGCQKTRLYFGTAVVADRKDKQGNPSIGKEFNFFIGFHVLYSRVLLSAARNRLVKTLKR